MMEYQGQKHFTPKEVADQIGTKDYTIRRWLRLGYLGSITIGQKKYISETHLADLVKPVQGE